MKKSSGFDHQDCSRWKGMDVGGRFSYSHVSIIFHCLRLSALSLLCWRNDRRQTLHTLGRYMCKFDTSCSQEKALVCRGNARLIDRLIMAKIKKMSHVDKELKVIQNLYENYCLEIMTCRCCCEIFVGIYWNVFEILELKLLKFA